MARLEHINLTVPDARATSEVLQDLFGWTVRWEGRALNDGYTVHVGAGDSYLALYTPKEPLEGASKRYTLSGAMNHIGVVVDDLDATEAAVKARGYPTHSHADYEPGRRFYFDGPDGVEYEMVSYG